jgi:hypothetical protein
MMYEIYTCRHCGFEAYYLEAMLKHQAESHPKLELMANDRVEGRDAASSRRAPWNDWFGVFSPCRQNRLLRR